MATMSEKPVRRFRRHSVAPPVRQGGRRACSSASASSAPKLLKDDAAKAARSEELARPHAPQFVDRDSPRQHDPDSHRQERLRPGHHLHRLPPDRGRRVERAVRSHHHGHRGRYRSHARRQRRLRFPRPRNAEHPQSGGLHLSGPARSRVAKTWRAEETSSP